MPPLTVTGQMVFPSKVSWTMWAGESLDGKGILLCLVLVLSYDMSVQFCLVGMTHAAPRNGTLYWFLLSPSTSTVIDGVSDWTGSKEIKPNLGFTYADNLGL